MMIGTVVCKIATYNYLAGVWEPFVEKTNIQLEVVSDNSEPRSSRQVGINIMEYKPKQGMNINISDLTVRSFDNILY